MYTWTYDVADGGVTVADVDLTVSSGQDVAGNTQVSNTNADYVDIDTQNPTVTGVVASDLLITDADAGHTMTVTADFSEAMSSSATPTLVFAPSIATTLAFSSGTWVDGDTYRATYAVSDGNVDHDSVTADVINAEDVAGNAQADYTPVHEFEVDTQNPTVVIAANDVAIYDGDVGVDHFTVTATYSEAMNPAIVPSLVFLPGMATTFTNPSAAWSVGNTVYTWTYDVADDGATVPDVDLMVSGGADVSGNTQIAAVRTDYIDVDLQNPTVVILANDVAIYDGDVGVDRFTVTATFSEAMNPAVAPTLTFTPAVASTFANPSGAWSVGNTVYTWTYDVADGGVTVADVDLTVSSGQDVAGNTQVSNTNADYVDIDTQNPTVVIAANDVAIYDGDVGVDHFTVTATYSEAMNPAVVPTLTFTPNPTTTFTNPSGAWSGGNTVYTWTYDVADGGVTVADVDLTVSSGQDVAGNTQVSNTNADYVDIDTQNPTVVIAANDVAIYDGDVGVDHFTVTATYSEAMNPAVVPTLTFTPNPTTTFTNVTGAWTGDTIYAWTYDVVDSGVTTADVDLRVSGGRDVAGNVQVTRTNTDYVDVDTRNPIATVTVNRTIISLGSPVYENALILTVTVTYDEAMNTSTSPVITLENEGAHWGPQTPLGWTGNTVYRATFTHDGTEEPVPPAAAPVAFARVTSASGATDVAGNSDIGDDSPTFEIDTRKPRATVTTDHATIAAGSPIYEGSLVLTVTVTYDEPMNPTTQPVITLPGGGTNWGLQTPEGWSAGNTVYRATFTHNGTEEPTPPAGALVALARVANASGARDLAGNADVGDDSTSFEIDTRKPELAPGVAAVAVDTDPVYEGDLVQVVTVTFDEAMRSNGTAEPTITFSRGTWTAGAAGVWSSGDTVWTRTYTVVDNDEEVADVTVDVTGTRDAAGNAQENYAPAREFTLDTLQPSIVEIDAQGQQSCGGFYCSGAGDTVVVSVTFSEGVVLASGTFNVTLDVLPSGFEIVYPTGKFAPPTGLPVRWNDYTIDQNYVVQAGHNSCDLESTAVGWTAPALTDVAGNLAITDMPPLDSRIKALRDIIVDTTPPQAFADPGVSDTYVYVQPAYLSWHEFVEDRERIIAREDCPIYIDVLSNDFDNCLAGLSVTTATVPAPSYGVTSLFTDGGTGQYPVLPGACDAKVVRYSPYSDYSGPDEFGYTARDCSGNTSDAMVYLYVFAKNSLGSAVPNAFSGVPVTFRLETRDDLLLRIADAERFVYRFELPAATEHGVLMWRDDAIIYDHGLGVASLDLVYTSADGYEGVDVFTWSVTDPFGIVQEKAESFSVVQADAGLVPLVPTLELRTGGVAHLAVPGGLFDVGGVAAIRIQRLGAFGEAVEELAPSEVAKAIAMEPSRGNGVLGLDASTLPSGLLRLLIPVGDGMICSVLVEVGGGGGQ